MSKTKFTPGPWNVTRDHWGPTCINTRAYTTGPAIAVLTRQGDEQRARFTDACGGYGLEETKANAALIAAAPDLYQALIALSEGLIAIDELVNSSVMDAHSKQCIRLVRDGASAMAVRALTRAEGRSP